EGVTAVGAQRDLLDNGSRADRGPAAQEVGIGCVDRLGYFHQGNNAARYRLAGPPDVAGEPMLESLLPREPSLPVHLDPNSFDGLQLSEFGGEGLGIVITGCGGAQVVFSRGRVRNAKMARIERFKIAAATPQQNLPRGSALAVAADEAVRAHGLPRLGVHG